VLYDDGGGQEGEDGAQLAAAVDEGEGSGAAVCGDLLRWSCWGGVGVGLGLRVDGCGMSEWLGG